ncbi:type II secretion system secretin GspD [Gilvimarinus agarilyticus]|uniref:type II secretion system secretin GspD n=1 Tax=Gilvimarinus agarilyticus TaxID=679259 RepID=UPI000697DAA6|nr:type II secretion system secretin GspD [Gilvimarinus agarilyticus]
MTTRQITKPFYVALITFLLAGCATTDFFQQNNTPSAEPAEEPPLQVGEVTDERDDWSAEKEEPKEPEQQQAQLFPASGGVVNMPAARNPVALQGEDVTLNFQNTPLIDVVNGIMGDILGLDYIVEGKLAGQVSLRTRSAIPVEQLMVILESMLEINGASIIKTNSDRYIVSSNPNLQQLAPRYSNPKSTGAGFSNVIVPLEYIGASQMVEILQPVAPESAFVRVDTLRNLLILGGTRTQVDGWLEIVRTFDVDFLAGMAVGIFPIEYSTAEEVANALTTVLSSGPGGEASELEGLVRIVPLDSLGSILVVTPKNSYLEKIKTWVSRLDKAPDASTEPQLYVYEVENGDAVHLAQLLSSVFGGGSAGGAGSINDGVAPGLTATSTSNTGGIGSDGSNSNNQNSRRNSNSSSTSFSFGDSAKIIADDINNSLLIYAKASDYRKIEPALKRLDIVPLQVLIEASILEVTLRDELRYGLEWYFDNSLGDGWTGSGQLDLGDGGIGRQSGFSYTFNNPLGDLRAVINSLADKQLVNVISTPSIMVLDNHSAAIHVGNQQPVRSSSTVTDGGTVSNSINYRDTGVKLEVVPSVNSGGLVSMSLMQSVTDIGPVDDATGQTSFYERNINSEVAVRSGESVVLGGLIKDNKTTGKSGVPFFQDLPIIGSLFGTTSIVENRTELLVIITPHVIQSDQQLRDVTSEMRKRMKGLDIFNGMYGSGVKAND